MLRLLSVFLPVLLWSVMVFGQEEKVVPQKLKKFKFDLVKVKLPEDFVPMETEAFFRQVATAVKPDIVYRDRSEQVVFTVNNSINRWGNNLTLLGDFQKATIMEMHKKVEFKRVELIERKKREYLVMIFESKIDDEMTPKGEKRVVRHYHYMMYTVRQGFLVTISLRMPLWMKELDWEEAADEIMESILIKK